MNGRVYDPNLGRFLSVDPVFQFPTNTQSLNPYSYVLNNPLSLTDPTGYTIDKGLHPAGEALTLTTPAGSVTATMNSDGTYSLSTNSSQIAAAIKKTFGSNGGSNGGESAASSITTGKDQSNVSGIGGAQNTVTQNAASQDLGKTGDFIRNKLNSKFAKKLFSNYWSGKGNYKLSKTRFNDVVNYSSKEKPIAVIKNIRGPNGEILEKRLYSFYGSKKYANAFGVASLFFNSKGKAVGFYDFYNFDSKKWGIRPFVKEIETRAVKYLGEMHGAKPFSITYGTYVSPN